MGRHIPVSTVNVHIYSVLILNRPLGCLSYVLSMKFTFPCTCNNHANFDNCLHSHPLFLVRCTYYVFSASVSADSKTICNVTVVFSQGTIAFWDISELTS